MKKILIFATFLLATIGLGTVVVHADLEMYRMYNPNSGEHFYTAARYEALQLQKTGWTYEGIGWVAPKSGVPVYRVYNPNAGDHMYTTSNFEKAQLVKAGWNDEGTGWYSGGSVPIYREYNPNATTGTHNYTPSLFESQSLASTGWKDEGIAWYGTGTDDEGGILADFDGALATLNQLRATSRQDVATSGDGAARSALTLDQDLNNWAQTRANELATNAGTSGVVLSHADMSNGMPSWASGSLFKSPNYVSGSVAWGPEVLYYESGTDADAALNDAISVWWGEYNNGSSSYSHYLTLSSPLANHIGFGLTKTAGGAIIVVGEVGYR